MFYDQGNIYKDNENVSKNQTIGHGGDIYRRKCLEGNFMIK
jgi:hypothetical protein